jgi:hypothetical protein
MPSDGDVWVSLDAAGDGGHFEPNAVGVGCVLMEFGRSTSCAVAGTGGSGSGLSNWGGRIGPECRGWQWMWWYRWMRRETAVILVLILVCLVGYWWCNGRFCGPAASLHVLRSGGDRGKRLGTVELGGANRVRMPWVAVDMLVPLDRAEDGGHFGANFVVFGWVLVV